MCNAEDIAAYYPTTPKVATLSFLKIIFEIELQFVCLLAGDECVPELWSCNGIGSCTS